MGPLGSKLSGNKYSKFFIILLGGIVWLFIIAILIIPFSLLFLSKLFVILLAKIFRRDLHPVSTGDAAFAIGCTWEKSKLSLGLLCHVQGHLKLEQVQDRFSISLLQPKLGDRPKYDKLFSCLVTFCGYVFRKTLQEDKIDLNKMIYERVLRVGEELEQVIDDWMEKKYGEMAPAWEVMVLPMGEETVIAFKIHHVFADGYSMLHILDTLTGSKAPYLVKETNESVWKKISDILCTPLNLKMIGSPAGPRSSPLRVEKPQTKWIHTFTTVDLAPIKAIRRKYDVHFATIILSLIVGSIRQYLLEKKTENELPSHFTMANTLPCELHPSQDHVLCNHWTLGLIKSPIAVDNPLQRVIETEKFFKKFHESSLDKVAVNYLFPTAWLFPQFIAEKALEKDLFGFNSGLTSLIGANDYKFLGQRITTIHPLLTLIDSHPFTVFSWFTFSHSNKLDITLSGAPDLFPCRTSLSRIASEYFNAELHNLCAQCGISPDNVSNMQS